MESLETLLEQFKAAMSNSDKALAISIFRKALSAPYLSVPTLYERILAPSLNCIASNRQEQNIPIWKEHLLSGYVRTALELAYPRVLEDKAPTTGLRALVCCPEEEYHELGARMTADYLTLLGFETHYIGANTPNQVLLDAITFFVPAVVCLSLTNYYHLSKLHALMARLPDNRSYKVVVGGYAVHNSINVKTFIKADYYAGTFADLEQIKEAIL